MSRHIYDVCCDHIGKGVRVTCYDGTFHHGVVQSVDHDTLYLIPMHSEDGDRFIVPALIGLALGSIAGLALAPRPCIYPVPITPYPYPYY